MTRRPTTDSLPAEEWAGAMGERWLTHLDRFEGMIGPIGQALLNRADFRPGERVLDRLVANTGDTLDCAGHGRHRTVRGAAQAGAQGPGTVRAQ